jgi:hypothetical protein
MSLFTLTNKEDLAWLTETNISDAHIGKTSDLTLPENDVINIPFIFKGRKALFTKPLIEDDGINVKEPFFIYNNEIMRIIKRHENGDIECRVFEPII